MNQTRSVKKIIKKRKTKKYVSSVIEKSVKVMQRTVFGFNEIMQFLTHVYFILHIAE